MYKKTKVLLIAPYEGLKEAVLGVLPQYQDKLELTMSLGDLTSGVQQAQTAQTQGYDVIISRGGTAELIARNVPLMRFKIYTAIDKEKRNDNFLITLCAGDCYSVSCVVVVDSAKERGNAHGEKTGKWGRQHPQAERRTLGGALHGGR